jgi:flagella basal body P-ring formation protein FlgA
MIMVKKNKIMLLLILINGISGLASNTTMSIKSSVGPFCSSNVSWTEMLDYEESLLSTVKCMDEVSPLKSLGLNKTRLVSQLKNLKTQCHYNGSLQIPEKVEVKIGELIDEEFIEKSIASLAAFRNQKIEIKILRMIPLKLFCQQIKSALVSEIKIEGKNFFRWNLDFDGINTSGGTNITLSGEFKVMKDVPVLKAGLSIGDRISSEDWTLERRDITFQHDVLDRPDEFEGHSLLRGLISGSFIRLQDLKREFLVEKNQIVKIKMAGSEFEITSMAIAESSGFQGDLIKLKNPDTLKSFTGVAVSKGLVEIR